MNSKPLELVDLARIASEVVSADLDWALRGELLERHVGVLWVYKLREIVGAMDRSGSLCYAGALAVLWLRQHPWVDAFELELWRESEFDDQGGSFLCANARVHSVSLAAAERLAEMQDLPELDGYDEDSLSEDMLLDDQSGNLCSAFMADDDSNSVQVRVNRASVASLVASDGPISGESAVRLLWPEHTHVLDAARKLVDDLAREGEPQGG